MRTHLSVLVLTLALPGCIEDDELHDGVTWTVVEDTIVDAPLAPTFTIEVEADYEIHADAKRIEISATTPPDGILLFTQDAPTFEPFAADATFQDEDRIGGYVEVNESGTIKAEFEMDCLGPGTEIVTIEVKAPGSVTLSADSMEVVVDCGEEDVDPDEPAVAAYEILDGDVTEDEEGCVVFGDNGGRIEVIDPLTGEITTEVTFTLSPKASDWAHVTISAFTELSDDLTGGYAAGVVSGELLGGAELVLSDPAGNPLAGANLSGANDTVLVLNTRFNPSGEIGANLSGDGIAPVTSNAQSPQLSQGDIAFVAGRQSKVCGLRIDPGS